MRPASWAGLFGKGSLLVDGIARLSNGLWSGAAALTTVTLAVAAFKVISAVLGVEQLGVWALVTASLFLLRFADLGISAAILRYVGRMKETTPRAFVFRVLGVGGLINMISFAGFLALSAFTAPSIIHRTVPEGEWTAAFMLLPYVMGLSAVQLVQGMVSNAVLGAGRLDYVYKTGIVIAVVQIVLIVPTIMQAGLIGYVVLQMACLAVQALVLVGLLLRTLPSAGEHSESFDLRAFLSFAFRLNANAFLATLIDPLSKIMLGQHGTLAVVGTYEVVNRILGQLRTVLVAPMQPLAVSMIRQHGSPRFFESYNINFMLGLVCAALLVLAGLMIWSLGALLIALDATALGPAVLACTTLVTFGVIGMAAYNASMAVARVWPVMASTVIALLIIGGLGLILGSAFEWRGVMAAIAAGHAIGTATMIYGTGRMLHFESIPTWGHLVTLAARGLAMIKSRWK